VVRIDEGGTVHWSRRDLWGKEAGKAPATEAKEKEPHIDTSKKKKKISPSDTQRDANRRADSRRTGRRQTGSAHASGAGSQGQGHFGKMGVERLGRLFWEGVRL
jgi:hypothetical protein